MVTWIVLRYGPDNDSGSERAVVGSITTDDELEAKFAAHTWWMNHVEDRLEVIRADRASEVDCRAARGCTHLDLAEERQRLDAVFSDRLVP